MQSFSPSVSFVRTSKAGVDRAAAFPSWLVVVCSLFSFLSVLRLAFPRSTYFYHLLIPSDAVQNRQIVRWSVEFFVRSLLRQSFGAGPLQQLAYQDGCFGSQNISSSNTCFRFLLSLLSFSRRDLTAEDWRVPGAFSGRVPNNWEFWRWTVGKARVAPAQEGRGNVWKWQQNWSEYKNRIFMVDFCTLLHLWCGETELRNSVFVSR